MVDEIEKNDNPNVPTLKEVRERLGMTQDEFAKTLGLSRNTIGSYEGGKSQGIHLPIGKLRHLIRLMEAAGMSVNDLPDDIS